MLVTRLGAVLASSLAPQHFALLVADLALGSLVAEDLDLAVGAVQQHLLAVVTAAVGVHLQVQGQALYALLGGEVRTQAVHRHVDLMMGDKADQGENRVTFFQGCVITRIY